MQSDVSLFTLPLPLLNQFFQIANLFQQLFVLSAKAFHLLRQSGYLIGHVLNFMLLFINDVIPLCLAGLLSAQFRVKIIDSLFQVPVLFCEVQQIPTRFLQHLIEVGNFLFFLVDLLLKRFQTMKFAVVLDQFPAQFTVI